VWFAEWSAPSAIGIAGLGGGFEVGAEVNTAYLSFGRNEVVQLLFCCMSLMKQALSIITISQGQTEHISPAVAGNDSEFCMAEKNGMPDILVPGTINVSLYSDDY